MAVHRGVWWLVTAVACALIFDLNSQVREGPSVGIGRYRSVKTSCWMTVALAGGGLPAGFKFSFITSSIDRRHALSTKLHRASGLTKLA